MPLDVQRLRGPDYKVMIISSTDQSDVHIEPLDLQSLLLRSGGDYGSSLESKEEAFEKDFFEEITQIKVDTLNSIRYLMA